MQLQKNRSTKEVVETIGHSAFSNMITSHLHHDFLTGKERSSQTQNNVSKSLEAEMQEYVLNELEVCSNAAAKYPNNYNAWSHRIWLIRNICHCSEEVGKAPFLGQQETNVLQNCGILVMVPINSGFFHSVLGIEFRNSLYI